MDFSLPSSKDSSLVSLSDYVGKVILINWWRTECGFSQREAPRLVALYNKFRDSGLVIIGVSDDTHDTVLQVPSYLQQFGITWAVGLNDQAEFTREIRSKGLGDTPGNYLFSKSGELTYLGLDRTPEDWTKLENAVIRLLAEPTPSVSAITMKDLETAPSFSLADINGNTVNSSSFTGKPLVVNFFTSQTQDWAGEVLSKLHNDNAANGLQVVGINLYDDDNVIKQYIDKYNIKYRILRGDQAAQLAWISSNKGWATFFLTRDGKTFKKIWDSIECGLEGIVFQKYADYLLAQSP